MDKIRAGHAIVMLDATLSYSTPHDPLCAANMLGVGDPTTFIAAPV